jgi:subtilase family serine protease
MNRRHRQGFRAFCEPLEHRSLLSTLTPTQMRHAYGVDAVQFSANGQTVPGTGAGQTIAIVVASHNPYLSQELQAFDTNYGLADPSLTQVNLAGGSTDDGWAQEEALDVEWAHAMAPGASIVAVEARSASIGDLLAAVNVARQMPGVSVVSMSWGGGEFRGQTGYDGYFTTPSGHNGVTFVTASGDSGAWSGAQWPASSSQVVAVGGTTLRTDSAGNSLSESAWYASGGGLSRVVAEPSYQRSVQRSGRRSTPDVAMDGDPATGVAVYTISPSTGQGSWAAVGGTSLSAQLFGGLVAIADQGRALRGAGTLDGGSQTLPALYSVSSADFRDVTAGSNGYAATPGYDLATGRGSPGGNSLVADLVSYTGQASATTRAGRIIRRTPFRFSVPRSSTTQLATEVKTAFVFTSTDLASGSSETPGHPEKSTDVQDLATPTGLVDSALAKLTKIRSWTRPHSSTGVEVRLS